MVRNKGQHFQKEGSLYKGYLVESKLDGLFHDVGTFAPCWLSIEKLQLGTLSFADPYKPGVSSDSLIVFFHYSRLTISPSTSFSIDCDKKDFLKKKIFS